LHATNYFLVQKNLPKPQLPPDAKIPKKIYWFFGKADTGKSDTARTQMRRLWNDMHMSYNILPM
jgi:hypothetical protein